jgi:hypothetical protein
MTLRASTQVPSVQEKIEFIFKKRQGLKVEKYDTYPIIHVILVLNIIGLHLQNIKF